MNVAFPRGQLAQDEAGGTKSPSPPMNSLAFVLIGATGDLARRMLWPSLHALYADGLLPKNLRIVAAGRVDLSQDGFRDVISEALQRFAGIADASQFLNAVHYVRLASDEPASLKLLSDAIAQAETTVFYLSTPPDQYGAICQALDEAGLACPSTRLVLEKPIGSDLISSRAVNEAVGAVFAEHQIFRIDHYLGKETVQNLLALRFGNGLFEPLWNASSIDHVQITVAETVGLEGRWSYYDGAGALRDMVQNHMLQLLALIAMEAPASLDPSAVRSEKIKVLRGLRVIGAADIAGRAVFAQYSAGVADGHAVSGYRQEEEAGANSSTETFVAIRAEIDNWRWAGVPFYLRTGKRLVERRTEIVIQFKNVPHNIFADAGAVLEPNRLMIRLQPEETVTLHIMNKEPGLEGTRLQPLALNLSLTEAFGTHRRRIAHERLILDVLKGNSTLFVHRDEVEAAWSWIDGIHAGWQASGRTLRSYPAGSWGPTAAIALAERHGVSWHE